MPLRFPPLTRCVGQLRERELPATSEWGNEAVFFLFQAVIETIEEEILNLLFHGEDDARVCNAITEALPLKRVLPILLSYGMILMSLEG